MSYQENEKEKKLRTIAQNKAMHLWFTMLAGEFSDAGLDMKRVLKPEIEIKWTPQAVKQYIWKPVQEAMMIKKSTTELNTDEVTKIYEVINRHTAEKHGISVPFPSIEGLMLESELKKFKL